MFLLLSFACTEITTQMNNVFQKTLGNYDGDPYDDASDCDDSNPGLPQWYYKDADGDGFGLQTDSHLWCPDEKEDGYILSVERNGIEIFDCNDDPESGGASIHPDASEECDGVDNNCSGDIRCPSQLEHSGIWMAMAMVLGITYRRFEVAILLQVMWKMILIAMIQTHSSIFTLKVWKVGLSYATMK